MGDLSTHFSRHEFACHCGCGYGTLPGDVSQALVALLEMAREHFGEPVTIVSGCRCRKHNQAVGGALGSQHLGGKAADIKIQDVSPKAVADWLDSKFHERYGLGRYRTWTHIDVRPNRARWGTNT